MDSEVRPDLSVVVPTRDRPEMLAGCLVALRAVLSERDELIVVDSASTDPRVADIASAHGASYIRCEAPGASHARNTGWRAARNEVVAFVDDDVRAYPGWAEAFACCAARFPDAGFITGKIGSPPDDPPEFAQALMLEPDPMWIDANTPAPIGHTASLVVRRSVLERLGGFDELLGTGARYRAAEDQDLFDRALAAGVRGRYEPEAFAIHEAWRGRSDVLGLEWSYGVGSGARLAKLVKRNRGSVRKIFRENVGYAFRAVLHAMRVRYKFLLLIMTARLAGTLVGFVRAIFRPVKDGHFRS